MKEKTLFVKFINGDVRVFAEGWTNAGYENGYLVVRNGLHVVLAAPADKVNYYRVTDGI